MNDTTDTVCKCCGVRCVEICSLCTDHNKYIPVEYMKPIIKESALYKELLLNYRNGVHVNRHLADRLDKLPKLSSGHDCKKDCKKDEETN